MRFVLLAALIAAAPFTASSVEAAPRRRPHAIDVTGTYDSNYGVVRLEQHGNYIEGEYVCCGGGTLHGKLDGRVIKFHWEEAGDGGAGAGQGVWKLAAAGALRGSWGYGDSDDDGGEWNLDRVDTDSKIAN
jgi:hypothetical protein